MHSLTHIGPGDVAPGGKIPLLQPAIREVGFEEDPAQFTVAHLLIHAWSMQRSTPECSKPPDGDFRAWAQEINSLTREERENLPRDPDTISSHTPWRDQLYYMWNHVFYDVGNWMSRVYRTGSFKPPNTEVFVLEFPKADENSDDGVSPAVTKVWDSETLLIPAYLAPGVSVRVKTRHPSQGDDATSHTGQKDEPFHSAKFGHENRYNVWYIKKGLHMRFYVEGSQGNTDGVAAVMVYGNMLGEQLQFVDSESDDSEAGSDEEN